MRFILGIAAAWYTAGAASAAEEAERRADVAEMIWTGVSYTPLTPFGHDTLKVVPDLSPR